MSKNWAARQRRTNQLVRALAGHVLPKRTVTPSQLYGLCKLTWITSSFDGSDSAYIRSTKIPALSAILGENYSRFALKDVAEHVVEVTGDKKLGPIILSETGFTHFYKAYRNTDLVWINDNFSKLLPMFRAAVNLSDDPDGRKLMRGIRRLDGIPKANHTAQRMNPAYLLTPAFFSLDPRLRFPLINGNEGVQTLLAKLQVSHAALEDQFQRMVGLYGKAGIKDAADLDQAGRDLPEFVSVGAQKATKKFLEPKPTKGKKLPLKDEDDIEALQKARKITSKRLHNKLTNKFTKCLADFTLLEGTSKSALFDVLVRNIDGKGRDLLIEVKSSTEAAHIRMAIGQLFDYWFTLNKTKPWTMALLLPNIPDDKTKDLLEWLKIGVLWFSGDHLETSSEWLRCLASRTWGKDRGNRIPLRNNTSEVH